MVDGAGQRTILPHYIYVAVASAIRDTAESQPLSYNQGPTSLHPDYTVRDWQEALDVVADKIGDALAEQNPYFDKDIFLEVCGAPGWWHTREGLV